MSMERPAVRPTDTAVPGWTLMAMLGLALCAALTPLPGYVAGVPVWIAAALLIRRQRRSQIIQSLTLLLIGVAGLLIGTANGVGHRYLLKAIEANQLLIAMLVGVSFLRLFATAGVRTDEQLPAGRNALLRTLCGTHLIGSVINVSAMMIIGDRLSAHRPLTPLQGLTLLRGFTSCACWSPFFASMGVVMISAPGVQLGTLIQYGVPTALVALAFSARQISRMPQSNETKGYPMHMGALRIPLLLAVLVIIAHYIWPSLSVLTLVTLISLLVTICAVPMIYGRDGVALLGKHVSEGLPKLGGEVVLFLAAAVLAAGVAAATASLDIQLAPEHFGAMEACLTLLLLVALAMIGMHPVTSAVLAGSLLMPSVSDPNLLGITLLFSWSLGIGLSPFSGTQISLQSRYGLSPPALAKMNSVYGPFMLVTACAVIWIYASNAGIG